MKKRFQKKGKSPSPGSYKASHPTYSIRIPLETRNKFFAKAQILGMSPSGAFKAFVDDLEVKARPVEEAYQRGFAEAEKLYAITCPCSVCGKLLIITNPKTKEIVAKFLSKKGLRHVQCPTNGSQGKNQKL